MTDIRHLRTYQCGNFKVNTYINMAVQIPMTNQPPMSKQQEQEIENDLIRSRIQTLMDFPFFGILAVKLDLVIDYSIPTASTNGSKFFYNPYYIKSLSEYEKNWVIVHEVMHCALKHLWRRGNREPKRWNYACDYAIHDIMMQFKETADYDVKNNIEMPNGVLYDPNFRDKGAEEIYELLPENFANSPSFGRGSSGEGNDSQTPLDDHSHWEDGDAQRNAEAQAQDWENQMISAAKAAESKSQGNVPGFLKRLLNKLTKPQKDWRTLLAEFIEPEMDDWGWTPPSNRYPEIECFMPEYSEVSENVKHILFWIDTSGSIGDKEIAVFYSEIKGAIEQFKSLTGMIGFFDHIAYEPKDFNDVQSAVAIRPVGGGGTCFHAPFEYIKEKMKDKEIAGIVMLTDGYASFPDEKIAEGIPVLWVITNGGPKPNWGLVTDLKV
jgi:predicted metal-dependent peptidase